MLRLSKKVASVQKSKTLLLTAIAKEMRSEGIDVVSLTAGEPDFPTPNPVKEAAIHAIEDNFTKYTPNEGILELRKAIAEKFQRDNHLHFDPAQILVSCGAKHSIYNALQAICNREDEVLLFSPYWVSYPDMVKLVDGVPKILPVSEASGGRVDLQQLRRAITQRTKVLILNSPSNPSGVVYNEDEITGIAEIVAKAGIFVISDEIYEKVIYDDARHFSIGSVDAIRDQVVTVNGVSKAYSMTGWRIGFLGASKEVVSAAEKVQSQVTSNPSSISQRAALAALTMSEATIRSMVKEFKRRRDYFCGELREIEGIECPVPMGAFYVFPKVTSLLGKSYDGKGVVTTDDLSEYFLTVHHVATVPGTPFGSDDHIRMSYACSMEDLEKAIDRLRKAVHQLLS